MSFISKLRPLVLEEIEAVGGGDPGGYLSMPPNSSVYYLDPVVTYLVMPSGEGITVTATVTNPDPMFATLGGIFGAAVGGILGSGAGPAGAGVTGYLAEKAGEWFGENFFGGLADLYTQYPPHEIILT